MRKVGSLVLVVAFLGLAPAIPRSDAASMESRIGVVARPFREDGATFAPADSSRPNGLFRGGSQGRDDTGCKAPDASGHVDCLPAAASMTVLPGGRVLYWNALEAEEDAKVNGVLEGGAIVANDQSRLLHLTGRGPSWATPSPADGGGANTPEPALVPGTNNQDRKANDGSLFCSDQKLMGDGRVLTVGGTDYYAEPKLTNDYGVIELEGIKSTRIFDPVRNTWTQSGNMKYGRWYPSLVTLDDGKVFVAGGVTKLIKPLYPSHPGDSGTNVKQTETFDPATGKWTDNTAGGNAAAARTLPLYPRLHLLPNGNVYYDGAGQAYNPMGQSYDEVLWNIGAVYDTKAKAWRDLGVPGVGSAFPGFRGSTFSAALPLKAPYTSASFLTAGGVLGTTPGSYVPVADSRITTVSGGAGAESMKTIPTGALGRPRWYGTAVPLPDGTVLALSGSDVDHVLSPGSEAPIRQVEQFTPTYAPEGGITGGSWKDLTSAFRGRTYHNNAALLPDGRVLIGGHAPIVNGYGTSKTNPALPIREFANNFHDASFEIYSPPYLFRGERPVIGGMPATVKRGSSLTIPVKSGSAASVMLIRNTAQTHLIDGDARSVDLRVTQRSSGSITVQVPSGAVLPPGPYMLFVNAKSTDGLVPSVAKQVSVAP